MTHRMTTVAKTTNNKPRMAKSAMGETVMGKSAGDKLTVAETTAGVIVTGKANRDKVAEPASSGKPAAHRGATVRQYVTACRDATVRRGATVRRDGDAVVIDIPMSLRRRSGRKEVVLPPDAITASAVPTKPPAPLAVALARAYRWQEMIESGQAKSNSDLARQLNLDQSYIARTIRLASLAPNIIEAVLTNQTPDGLSLWALRHDLPLMWQDQRKQLGMEEIKILTTGTP